MSGIGLVGAIIVGALAGSIANLLLNQRHGPWFNLFGGLFGSFIGAFVVERLGIEVSPGLPSCLMVSTLGAILLLSVIGLFRRKAPGL